MSNTSNRKLRSLFQSRRRIALFIAILLLTCGLHASRSTSASSIDTVVVTPDVTTAPLLPVNHRVVDGGPNDQTDPHIDCNLVSYTNVDNGFPTVMYFDLLTNTGDSIPTQPPQESFLSDVNGTRIAYSYLTLNDTGTRVLSQIGVLDTSTNSLFTVPGGVERRNPSISGNLVAFEDRSVSPGGDIVVYNFVTGVTTQLTNDSPYDLDPAVAPAGDAVVFQKCEPQNFGCDVYSAIQTAPDVFTVSQLTGSASDSNVETNGSIVVYESGIGPQRDIAYQPIAGGTETRIALPGEQRNPSIAGSVISFESEQSPSSYDLFVYDTTSNRLYRVTNTPALEFLNDITFCGDQFTVAYVTISATAPELDVHAITFQIPTSESHQIEDLIDLVISFDLKDGTENSLITKLQNALDALEANDTATACDALRAFTNEVTAQSGKKIPTAQADQLINSANQIKQTLGCQ